MTAVGLPDVFVGTALFVVTMTVAKRIVEQLKN